MKSINEISMASLNENEIIEYCLAKFPDTVLINSWGERSIFYNPQNKLKRGIYVLTIKAQDGPNDKASKLDREGVYRVNWGVTAETFLKLYAVVLDRPKAGETVDIDIDFSKQNELIPHPVYAWMKWVSILNPTRDKFFESASLIDEAYELAKMKFSKKKIQG